jgi:hypothetical protein
MDMEGENIMLEPGQGIWIRAIVLENMGDGVGVKVQIPSMNPRHSRPIVPIAQTRPVLVLGVNAK